MPWRDAFPPPSDVFDSLISFSNKAEAAPAHALDYLFSNLILSRQFCQTEGYRYLTHKCLTSYGQLVGDLPGANAREKGRAGAGGTHTVPPLRVLASSSISTPSHPLQPGPDTHVSISGAPAPACPSSLPSSFVNLHLPPRGWLVASSAGTAALLLPSNAQFPQMSPNCACLRLRKEAGVPPPSLSGSGPPHSPFPPTPLRLANLAIGFRTGGYLQRQSVLHLRMSAMGTRHTQEGPTDHVPRQGTVWEAGGGWLLPLHPFSPLLRRR